MKDLLSNQEPNNPIVIPPVELKGNWAFWEQVILVGISVGVLNSLFSTVKDVVIAYLKQREGKHNHTLAIESITKIYDILQQLQAAIHSDSLCICKVSNGGEVPKNTSSLYITILYEVVEDPLYSVKEFWQQRPLSRQLFSLVDRTRKESVTYFNEDHDLEEIVKAEGMDNVVTIPLGQTEKEFFFLLVKYKVKNSFDLAYKEAKVLGFAAMLWKLLKK